MKPESSLSGKTLAVIGGGQGWGAKIARTGKRLTGSVDVVEQDTSSANRDSIIKAADAVFFAAPDTAISQILRDVRKHLEGKSVLDCATNKSQFAEDLESLARDASVCSTHPMVRSETSARNQNVLIMPVGEHAESATRIAEDLFGSLRMRLCRFPFEQHVNSMVITQFKPHFLQRVLIDALGTALQEQKLDFSNVSDIAPANFNLTTLAMGRVAIQRSDVSAGIIAEALHSPYGRRVLAIMRDTFERIVALSEDREALAASFEDAACRLDPSGSWRAQMNVATENQIEALGNLARSSFTLEVDNDHPGLLADISSFLAERGLNMNAIHSHTLEHDDCDTCGVRFTIGLEQHDVDWVALDQACRAQGWTFKRLRRPS